MRFFYGLLLICLSTASFADTAAEVTISEPFARSAMAHQKNSAVFMTIFNQGDDSAVVAASSPVAEVVELHTHTMDNGVMRMRRIEKIDLPSGNKVMLKPGGLHVMLIGLKQALEVDSEIAVTLEYADGSRQSLTVPVVHVMRGQKHTMDHDKGHGMDGAMKHDKAEGHAGGYKQCHAGKYGKGHGEDGEHGEGMKHGKCNEMHQGQEYGKGYEECHAGKHGKGHGEGDEHGAGMQHGKCHEKHHGKDDGLELMDQQ